MAQAAREYVAEMQARCPRAPLYIQNQEGEVDSTRTLIEGRVYADYDAQGNLLGIEVVK